MLSPAVNLIMAPPAVGLLAGLFMLLVGASHASTAAMSGCVSSADLQAALQRAIEDADFGGVFDRQANATTHAPLNADVSVISFGAPGGLQHSLGGGSPESPRVCPTAHASVLTSRDWPKGRVMHPSERLGADWSVGGVDWRWWDYPRWEAPGTGGAWTAPPSGHWYGRLVPHRTNASDPVYMVSHPASCFKLMLAAGLMRCVQEGTVALTDRAAVNITVFPDGGSRMEWNTSVAGALEAMLQVSDNRATTAIIATLHRSPCSMLPDRLMGLLSSVGLHTLQLNGTLPGGYWGGVRAARNRSSDYDTTGFFEMTSWDAARLMWLFDPAAPPLPPQWTGSAGAARAEAGSAAALAGVGPIHQDDLLNQTSRQYLFNVLTGQAFHDCLSTTATCGRPGRVPGLPSREPAKWVLANGSVIIDDGGDVEVMTTDVFPCQDRAELAWAHKTGLTYTFGSAVGSATSLPGASGRHYLIAMFGNLGSRFTDTKLARLSKDPCEEWNVCYTQRVPALAAKIDALLAKVGGAG